MKKKKITQVFERAQFIIQVKFIYDKHKNNVIPI